MKEIEITLPLNLSDKEKGLLDMHSFLNLMNVLLGEISIMELSFGSQPGFSAALAIAEKIKGDLEDVDKIKLHLGQMKKLKSSILNGLFEGFTIAGVNTSDPEVEESVSNINSVLDILEVRSYEILARFEEPDKWIAHQIGELKQNMIDVFAAIEKNSKGRYSIVYNIASKSPDDYIVDLNIDSVDGDIIYMPPVLQDVLRDIVANARKYSNPGGRISAGLKDDGQFLKIVVQDEGRGIPDNQISEVVNYGIRASNVGIKETMGGGLGLTKAYFITKQFGGKMWIKSEENQGTTIRIQIPVQHSSRS
jgi:signal transduction histidine kinase